MVDHVIAPPDADHARVVRQVSVDLATDRPCLPGTSRAAPHVTIASYTDLEPATATRALGQVLRATRPFRVRAHGNGLFSGDADRDLSLHVMVVRTRALDDLRQRVQAALATAGACLAGTTDPSVWTPYITLLDRGLTPRLLGQAVELLARRPHRTWTIIIASLAIARRHGDVDMSPAMALGTIDDRNLC